MALQKVGLFITLLVFLCALTNAVDRNNFKTCDQSSFCRRCRKVPQGQSPYELLSETFKTYPTYVESQVVNRDNGVLFILQLFAIKDNTFRVTIDEKSPLHPRYRVKDALKEEPTPEKLTVESNTGGVITIVSGPNKAVLTSKPLRLDFYSNGDLVTSLNSKGLLRVEHLRTKSIPKPAEDSGDENNAEENVPEVVKSIEDNDPGSWEENYKSHHDSKPFGPEAVALDFSFPGAAVLFGIPEHADSFVLSSTEGAEPYRLYNLDVFEYELDNGMAIYGSVPVLYAHGPDHSVGIYWQNAAETWVDISGNSASNVVSSIVNFVSGSPPAPPLGAHFMSENGIVDVFVLLGPKPLQVFQQYTALTGVAPLPQYFAIAYHQCRWNYNDEKDVMAVQDGFDEHDIPMDVIWLDIEHTDNKKYFTWDPIRFANPVEMTNNLTALGRKLVVIVDPHIKRDSNYFLHNDATDMGYYVKDKTGKDYEGWCWPGAASYLDLFDPVVKKYYTDRYLLENYKGSTLDTYIWNDMNEPSVFNGPEITMPKDNVHHGGWEHRTVHNLYALLHTLATYEGLLARSNNKLRPFILTRGVFSGSQRYTAIWTGDNLADWGHLAISQKMCLSLAVSGISFCGADIGGFFGYPEAELMTRWYQAGAFQPFYRAHSHIDTKRREPWLYPKETTAVIRDAIRLRYTYLPHWYTMFWEHARTGAPIMRPLLAHYPQDKEVYKIDYEYLLADSLLVRPVVEPGVTSVQVYFPAGDIWYDIETYKQYTQPGLVTIPVTINTIPVYQRGGSIIPRKMRVRRSSALTHSDPFTLIVCLDAQGFAEGKLYIDDGQSFDYVNNKYVYMQLKFKSSVLTSESIDKNALYDTDSWLERVVIAGIKSAPSKILLNNNGNETTLDYVFDKDKSVLTIKKPAVAMNEAWKIELVK